MLALHTYQRQLSVKQFPQGGGGTWDVKQEKNMSKLMQWIERRSWSKMEIWKRAAFQCQLN